MANISRTWDRMEPGKRETVLAEAGARVVLAEQDCQLGGALLGEPDEETTTPTCWGSQLAFTWYPDDETWLWVTFLEDEWYQWGGTDPRFAAEDVALTGASMAWLEQWECVAFEMFTNELGGGWQSTHYGGSVSFDQDTGEVVSVGGRWEADFARLHTVVDDDPTLWCGD